MNGLYSKNKLLFWVLFTVNMAFVAYWSVLLFFNRFAQDDYGFMTMVSGMSPIDFVSTIYQYHSGRFVRYFIYWLKFRMLGKFPLPWLYPTFVYLVSIFSIFFISHKSSNNRIIGLLGWLCFNLLIFCNFEFCSFFWTAAVDFYASAFLYPLWLFYFCFVCNKKTISYFGILITSILIGGGCEAHSPLVLFCIFTYGLYCAIFKKTISKEIKRRLITAFILILLLFIIVFIAPGNSGRMSTYQDRPNALGVILISFKSLAFLLYLLLFRIPHFFVLALVSYTIGKSESEKYIFKPKTFTFYAICLLGMMWISTFPGAYGMGAFGFHRIYTPVVSFVIIFISVWGYLLGKSRINENRHPLCGMMASCLALLICIVLHIIIDAPIAKAYFDSDKRNIEICLQEKAKGRTEDLYLEPLAECRSYNFKSLFLGMFRKESIRPTLYYTNSIDKEIIEGTDTGFGNICMMNYYNLPFRILLIPDSSPICR